MQKAICKLKFSVKEHINHLLNLRVFSNLSLENTEWDASYDIEGVILIGFVGLFYVFFLYGISTFVSYIMPKAYM